MIIISYCKSLYNVVTLGCILTTIRQWDRGQAEAKCWGRGQSFEAEAEAEGKSLRLRPRPKFWPRGHFGLEDLTSLVSSKTHWNSYSSLCEWRRTNRQTDRMSSSPTTWRGLELYNTRIQRFKNYYSHFVLKVDDFLRLSSTKVDRFTPNTIKTACRPPTFSDEMQGYCRWSTDVTELPYTSTADL